ncbi:hypothetical protein OIO90_002620 [Microbotryomycetes sp. JL221]|nr:hypothetical protein OIO90_002620 [Microbotryomycetes sp. JL221]
MSLADFQFESYVPSASSARARTLSAQFRHELEQSSSSSIHTLQPQQQNQQVPTSSSSSSSLSSSYAPTWSDGYDVEGSLQHAPGLVHSSDGALEAGSMSTFTQRYHGEFGTLTTTTDEYGTFNNANYYDANRDHHDSTFTDQIHQLSPSSVYVHQSPTRQHLQQHHASPHHAQHQHQLFQSHHHHHHQPTQHHFQQPSPSDQDEYKQQYPATTNPGLGLEMHVDTMDEFGVTTSHGHPLSSSSALTISTLDDAIMQRGSRPLTARHRHSKSQSSIHHPYSGTSSPARSRSGSIRGLASLHITTPSTPGVVQFPIIMSPSPFKQPTTPTAATMDPAQSVRSSSPSSTSSVFGSNFGPEAMSRVESSSESSSVFGESVLDPTPPYRNPPSATGMPRSSSITRPGLSRRWSSPSKTSRASSKKLTDADRKAICLFRDANPGVKQDDIGLRFGIERSTVSKILKNRAKWIAIADDASSYDDSATTPGASATLHDSSGLSSQQASRHSTPEATLSSAHGSTMPSLSGCRYPQIDNELAAWARTQAQFGLLEDSALQLKAQEIASRVDGCERFKASNSWLQGFKMRFAIEAGSFLDSTSPTSQDRLELIAEDDGDDEVTSAAQDEDTNDASYDRPSTRSRRKTSRNRSSSRPSTAKAPTPKSSNKFADQMAVALGDVSSLTAEEHASRSALGHVSRFSLDNEATPTHSTAHSRATSATAEQRMFDSLYANGFVNTTTDDSAMQTDVSPATVTRPATVPASTSAARLSQATPSRRPSAQTLLTPLSIGDTSPADAHTQNVAQHPQTNNPLFSQSDLGSTPLQSPFHTNGSACSPYSQYAQQASGSGSNSPAPSFQHGRSGSIASTTSSYSGLTAFSSQNGNGTPLTGSLYGSFPASHSQPNSVPSTPGGAHGPGYFANGDGSRSQLQAAFVPARKQSTGSSGSHGSSPLPTYGMPAQPARRATISGASPFSGGNNPSLPSALAPTTLTTSIPTSTTAPFSSVKPPATHSATTRVGKRVITLAEARSSLETAFDYLKSAEAQGFAEPKDLLVIWELKEKMANAAAGAAAAAAAAASGSMNSSRPMPPTQTATTSNSSTSKFGVTGSRRIRLGRTQSASSISSLTSLTGLTSSLGLGSKRASLLDSSMGVTEESR